MLGERGLIKQMKVLFFDTETNGLPKNRYAPYTSTEMWPHVVQISWQIIDTDTWLVLKEEDHFLKPRTVWDKEAERIHQIPESIAKKFGKEPLDVFKLLQGDLLLCSSMVAHNMTFDKTAIMSELQRLYISGQYTISPTKFWNGIKEVCTMNATKVFCDLKFKEGTGLKFPRLNELYLKLFGAEYDISGANLHNAKHDVSCLVMCVKKLLELREFSKLL